MKNTIARKFLSIARWMIRFFSVDTVKNPQFLKKGKCPRNELVLAGMEAVDKLIAEFPEPTVKKPVFKKKTITQ